MIFPSSLSHIIGSILIHLSLLITNKYKYMMAFVVELDFSLFPTIFLTSYLVCLKIKSEVLLCYAWGSGFKSYLPLLMHKINKLGEYAHKMLYEWRVLIRLEVQFLYYESCYSDLWKKKSEAGGPYGHSSVGFRAVELYQEPRVKFFCVPVPGL